MNFKRFAAASLAALMMLSAAAAVFADGRQVDLPAPQMAYASALSGAAEVGGTADGSGTVIAILDTSFDIDHEIFALDDGTAVKLSADTAAALFERTDAYNYCYGFEFDASATYISAKIPFAYDYVDYDTDVTSAQSHGTAVASISAGSDADGGSFDGIAPNAQLLLMKIFDDDGNYVSDKVTAAAINDAVLLGADVINLSLGTGAAEVHLADSRELDSALEAAAAAGVVVTASAGNDGMQGNNSVYDLSQGITQSLASNPDGGLVAHPSTVESVLSVAAAVNRVSYASLIYNADGKSIGTTPAMTSSDTEAQPELFETYSGRTFTVVRVPGVGAVGDYDGLNVKGKAVLVTRGEIYFSEKIQNAASAGAAMIIIRNNVDNDNTVMLVDEDITIPAVMVGMADAEEFFGDWDGAGKFTVRVGKKYGETVENDDAGEPWFYSSWGSTEQLTLKPEIMAVGGTIMAAEPDGYAAVTGTSMSSPVAAGAVAALKSSLILQGWTFGADATDVNAKTVAAEDVSDFIKSRLMNTATPSSDEDGVEFSPRRQGAGLLSVEAASEAALSLYSGGEFCAKAELGEISVSYADVSAGSNAVSFEVTAHNYTNAERKVKLYGTLTRSDVDVIDTENGAKAFTAETNVALTASKLTVGGRNVNKNSKNAAAYEFTLAANESRTFTVTLALDRTEYSAARRYFTRGLFLEGYVYLEGEDGAAVSLPYMGFCGDWESLPVMDAFIYDGGEPFYADSGAVYSFDGEGLYINGEWRGKYYSELIAISPNDDGLADYALLYVNTLRSADSVALTVRYAATGETFEYDSYTGLAQKTVGDTDDSGWYILFCDGTDTLSERWHMADSKYTAVLTSFRDGVSYINENKLTFYVDTAAPGLSGYKFYEENGRRYLSVDVADGHYVKSVRLYSTVKGSGNRLFLYGESIMDEDGYYLSMIEKEVPFVAGAHTATVVFDVTDWVGEVFYLDMTDYAFNEATVVVG